MLLTDCHADSGAGYGEAHVVGEGDVDAEHARVVEELAEDELAVRRRQGGGAHRLYGGHAVRVRDDGAHLAGQAARRDTMTQTQWE